MTWFWLNIPLATAVFLAVSGIPMWLVLRRPGWAGTTVAEGRDAARTSRPVPAAATPVTRPAVPMRAQREVIRPVSGSVA